MTDADDFDLGPVYRAALKTAAVKYQREQMQGYAKLLVEVTEQYRGQVGGYRRLMGEVQRRCAIAAGFPPTFDAWKATRVTKVPA